jgi:photosystem II stability/assembly factor-like uncharacterized protein
VASILALVLAPTLLARQPAWVPMPKAAEAEVIGGPWAGEGPGPSENGQVEGIPNLPVTGAINALAPHPTDPDVLYLGAVGGGLWKTTNATAANPSWTPLTDAFTSLSTGNSSLRFDPTDATHATLVAGIGQSSSFGAGGPILGLLRTTDGGSSWALLDGGGVLTGKNMAGVAPRGATLVAAVNTANPGGLPNIGIFRSTDTGGTFTQVSGTGGLPLGRSFGLADDPSSGTVLYTAIRDAGVNNGVYKSVDTGATWVRVSDAAINALFHDTNPTTTNVKLSVGAVNNVYVAIANAGRLAGLFRSGNGGGTWTPLDIPTTIEGVTPYGIHVGGQAGLHFSMVASRTNPTLVYIGGDRQPGDGDPGASFPNSLGALDYSGRLFRVDASLPVGSQFQHLTHSSALGPPGGGTPNGSAPHADSRIMVLDANGDLLEGSDGGVYKRTVPGNNTGIWVSLIGNLVSTEFHGIAFDSNTDTVFGGTQDNGTPQQQVPDDPTWSSVTTGDGGDVGVDDTTTPGESVRYSSYQFLGAFARRTYDSANQLLLEEFPPLTPTSGPPINPQFYSAVKVNAIAGTRLVIGAANGVYESMNGGDTVAQLATNQPCMNCLAYGARRLGVDNPDVLYVGAGVQVLVRTTSGGSLLPSPAYTGGGVRGVAINPEDWQEALVINTTGSVFRTTDAGGSWSDVTFNLASFGVGQVRSVTHVAVGPGAALVGTNRGVYMLKLNTTSWDLFGTGLPNAPVYELDYDAVRDKLMAGLAGRGAWLLTPVAPSVPVEIQSLDVR